MLFRCAEEHVVDRCWIDTTAADRLREHPRGEFIAAHIAEAATGCVGAADGGAAAGDKDGLVSHRSV
jgi:hypothetical protein